jgi:GxxExxY protein
VPHLRTRKEAHWRAQPSLNPDPIRGAYDENGYRIDLLVGGLIVVELKAVPVILPVHRGQLLSYLKLGGFKLGYLLNFNVANMRDGVMRLVNGL